MDGARAVRRANHLVHAATGVTRERQRRNNAVLRPIAHVRSIRTSHVDTTPKLHPSRTRGNQRITRMLPILLRRLRNVAAPKRVSTRARLDIARRTRHNARLTIVHRARLRRRKWIRARSRRQRTLRKVAIPNRRSRVLVLIRHIRGLILSRHAPVFAHLHLVLWSPIRERPRSDNPHRNGRIRLKFTIRIRLRIASARARKHLTLQHILPIPDRSQFFLRRRPTL